MCPHRLVGFALVVPFLLIAPAQATEVAGVLNPSTPGPAVRLAAELDLQSGTTITGVRWFNNDSASTPVSISLVTGNPGTGGEVARFPDPEALSSSWDELTLGEGFTVGMEPVYVVFEWDSTPQRSGEGPATGAGVGYYLDSTGGATGLVSADGVSWMQIHESIRLAVEAVIGGASKVGAPDLATPSTRDQVRAVFPNPANPAVAVVFELASVQDVHMEVYDQRGRLVQRLGRSAVPAGTHELLWRGVDSRGARVASGGYHFLVRLGTRESVHTVTIVR